MPLTCEARSRLKVAVVVLITALPLIGQTYPLSLSYNRAVVDEANLISPSDAAAIASEAAALESETGFPLLVVTISSLNDHGATDMQSYSESLFGAWAALDSRRRDRGIVLIDSASDRKVWVELGRSWGMFEDDSVHAIEQQTFIPVVRRDGHSTAIRRTVTALAAMARRDKGNDVRWFWGLVMLALVVVAVRIWVPIRRWAFARAQPVALPRPRLLIVNNAQPLERTAMLHCPGCESMMKRFSVQGVLGAKVEIDLCPRCRAFWFEPFETIHLSPRSTLQIFTMIADLSKKELSSALPPTLRCPMCRGGLLITRDRQRNTTFQYWRCDRGHGRFTLFVDFLREKEFIKPLSPQQLAKLRLSIQMIHCSNCAGPIDLTKESVCPHCGAPLSMLDANKMTEMVQAAAADGAKMRQGAPSEITVPLFTADTSHPSRPGNLVDAGLQSVAVWLSEWLH